MTRHVFLNSLAVLALGFPASAALAGNAVTDDDIIVSTPHQQVVGRDPITGAKIILYTASVRVNIRDLDLRSDLGWDTLGLRVNRAGSQVCAMLDEATGPFSASGSDTDQCRSDAVRGAMRDARTLRTSPMTVAALEFRVSVG